MKNVPWQEVVAHVFNVFGAWNMGNTAQNTLERTLAFLPGEDEGLVLLERDNLTFDENEYIRDLASHHPFSVFLKTTPRHVVGALAQVWPEEPSFQAYMIWRKIERLVRDVPLLGPTQRIVLRVSVSDTELEPFSLPQPEEAAVVAAFDAATGIVRECVVPPTEAQPPVAELRIKKGMMVLIQPVPPLVNPYSDTEPNEPYPRHPDIITDRNRDIFNKPHGIHWVYKIAAGVFSPFLLNRPAYGLHAPVSHKQRPIPDSALEQYEYREPEMTPLFAPSPMTIATPVPVEPRSAPVTSVVVPQVGLYFPAQPPLTTEVRPQNARTDVEQTPIIASVPIGEPPVLAPEPIKPLSLEIGIMSPVEMKTEAPAPTHMDLRLPERIEERPVVLEAEQSIGFVLPTEKSQIIVPEPEGQIYQYVGPPLVLSFECREEPPFRTAPTDTPIVSLAAFERPGAEKLRRNVALEALPAVRPVSGEPSEPIRTIESRFEVEGKVPTPERIMEAVEPLAETSRPMESLRERRVETDERREETTERWEEPRQPAEPEERRPEPERRGMTEERHPEPERRAETTERRQEPRQPAETETERRSEPALRRIEPEENRTEPARHRGEPPEQPERRTLTEFRREDEPEFRRAAESETRFGASQTTPAEPAQDVSETSRAEIYREQNQEPVTGPDIRVVGTSPVSPTPELDVLQGTTDRIGVRESHAETLDEKRKIFEAAAARTDERQPPLGEGHKAQPSIEPVHEKVAPKELTQADAQPETETQKTRKWIPLKSDDAPENEQKPKTKGLRRFFRVMLGREPIFR